MWQYGFTPVHLAARAGHNGVLSQLRSQHSSMRITSRKNGLSALHVAAFYGEAGTSALSRAEMLGTGECLVKL